MTDKHTPEPWRIHRIAEGGVTFIAVLADDGAPVPVPVTAYREETPEELARLLRIVACVNACKGFPTELLEKHHIGIPLAIATAIMIMIRDLPKSKETAPDPLALLNELSDDDDPDDGPDAGGSIRA
jgi:hypothetical protein